MASLTTRELAESIKYIFLNQEKFIFDKYVPEFTWEGKFFGDYYNSIMIEPLGDNPPIFYHSLSPFDIVSHKAPDQAVVFQDGKVILNIDFLDFVNQRTGIMDALLLQSLGIAELRQKHILFIGTGKVACQSLIALKNLFPDLAAATCINNSGNIQSFVTLAKDKGVLMEKGSLNTISDYDFIFCHSDPEEIILTAEMKNRIKKGAVITTFVTTAGAAEVADTYFETNNANIIIDWGKTITTASDITRVIKNRIADPDKMIRLKDVFARKANLNSDAQYTLYRSHGTPMQNLAVLKLLLKK